jgi:hypothetical protein
MWTDPATDPAGSGQNGRDLAGCGWIRPDPAKHVHWNPATATERHRIPATIEFSPFVIFSCAPNMEKYFRENNIF